MVISSGAALRSFPWASAYGATKAAQRGFAEALRHELSGTGVGLTVVYPGEAATDLHAHDPRSVRLLGIAHGVSPKLADRLPRALRGGTAAQRAD